MAKKWIVLIADTASSDIPALPLYLVEALIRFQGETTPGILKVVAGDIEVDSTSERVRVTSRVLGLEGCGSSEQGAVLDLLGKYTPSPFLNKAHK